MKAADLDRRATNAEKHAETVAQQAHGVLTKAIRELLAAEADQARVELLRAAAEQTRTATRLGTLAAEVRTDLQRLEQRTQDARSVIDEAQRRAALAEAEFEAATAAGDVDKATALAAIKRTAPDVIAAQQDILTTLHTDTNRLRGTLADLTRRVQDAKQAAHTAVVKADSDNPHPDDHLSVVGMGASLIDAKEFPAGLPLVLSIITAAAMAPLLAAQNLQQEAAMDAARRHPMNFGLRRPTLTARPNSGLYAQPREIAAYSRPHIPR